MILLSICTLIVISCAVKRENTKLVYKECNETISQRQFIIESPGYPDNYKEKINCEYVLKGHAMCQTEFHFQFLQFDLEKSINCAKDRLEVLENENLCGIISGVKMYKTKSNYLRLKFVSDSTVNGKGFRLLVTRLPCEGNNHLNASVQARNHLGTKLNLPKCCGDYYNSRRFYLASPGFPYSNQAPSDCYYHIYRANPNICRLRIHFKYFSLGVLQGNFCEYGFLEIDGKQICGCRTELDVISQFDQFWGNSPKVIRYKNTGYFKNNYNGFVIEVVQDECPTRYSPSLETNKTSVKGEKVPQFYFYNDQLNRIRFPNSTKENIELADESKVPKVRIDYYFFKAPDDSPRILDTKYKEPRSYVETSSNDFFISSNDETSCVNWGTVQWNHLTTQVLWKKMPQCKITQPAPTTEKCYDIKNTQGLLNNPGYPNFYFGNLNCCYRFHKIDGYCEIQFHVFDFDLELSENCNKDSLILYNHYKYCGNTLFNTQFTFDLKNKHYEDMWFITDSCYCGRGFKLYYEHKPCVSTIPPVIVPTTPSTTTTSTTRPTWVPCGGNITSEDFEINFRKSDHEVCMFDVHQINSEYCGIKLWFTNVDLMCSVEYLIVNDDHYCGRVIGDIPPIYFDSNGKVFIQYRRRADHSLDMSSIIIRGQQLRNCLNVPAE